MNRWLKTAYKVAEHGVHRVRAYQLGCVIVRGGQVISAEPNYIMNHAEERAIRPHHDYSGATLYVVRRGGGISKPCKVCRAIIESSGISKIVYIGLDGTPITERIVQNHTSRQMLINYSKGEYDRKHFPKKYWINGKYSKLEV